VTVPDPFFMMYCAVTRLTRSGHVLGENERISAYDALRAITIDAAFLSFEDQIKGSLRPGKLADMTVLSDDPTTCTPEELLNIRCLGVILSGVWKPTTQPPKHIPLPTVASSSSSSTFASSSSSTSSESTDHKRQRI